MIIKYVSGDITSQDNPRDIIIAMNSTFEDVTGIGWPFVKQLQGHFPFELGSVLSFQFDAMRKIHMLICHNIGHGGWHEADKYVRIGMDHLWRESQQEGERSKSFSIVNIGTGDIGVRDGADPAAITTAIHSSYLPVTLYIRGEEPADVPAYLYEPLTVLRAWTNRDGVEELSQQLQ